MAAAGGICNTNRTSQYCNGVSYLMKKVAILFVCMSGNGKCGTLIHKIGEQTVIFDSKVSLGFKASSALRPEDLHILLAYGMECTVGVWWDRVRD